MRHPILLAFAAVFFAVAGCSEAERQDAGADLEAAAGKVGDETRDAVESPELRELGSEIKDAAGDAGQVLADTARGAVEGAREGAAKVERESGEAAEEVQN